MLGAAVGAKIPIYWADVFKCLSGLGTVVIFTTLTDQ